MTNSRPAARSRLQLILIAGLALASLGGAYLLFYVAVDGGLWGTTNHGEFVRPPVTAAELELRDAQGGAFSSGDTWWLWVVPAGNCGPECRDAVHQLRQLHILLHKDASRVRRALVLPPGTAAPGVLEEYPRLVALSGDPASLAPGVYVVDPLGNLVFHYPMSDAGKPVLDDLKRLLKVSQIG